MDNPNTKCLKSKFQKKKRIWQNLTSWSRPKNLDQVARKGLERSQSLFGQGSFKKEFVSLEKKEANINPYKFQLKNEGIVYVKNGLCCGCHIILPHSKFEKRTRLFSALLQQNFVLQEAKEGEEPISCGTLWMDIPKANGNFLNVQVYFLLSSTCPLTSTWISTTMFL